MYKRVDILRFTDNKDLGINILSCQIITSEQSLVDFKQKMTTGVDWDMWNVTVIYSVIFI